MRHIDQLDDIEADNERGYVPPLRIRGPVKTDAELAAIAAAEREAEAAKIRTWMRTQRPLVMQCEPDEAMRPHLEAVRAWAALDRPGRLGIAGPTGTGKTWLAWQAAELFFTADPERWREDASALVFWRVATGELPDRAKTCRLLVIDDLGQEPGGTPHAVATFRAQLLDVVDWRYDRGLSSVLTTNLGGSRPAAWREKEPDETILARYGTPIWSRLKPSTFVDVQGNDRRKR